MSKKIERILITSALPYANGPLHFGHIAGAYLPGDCYARFQRLLGSDVLYLCGSDEYGFAITWSAALAKRTPKEHVDLFHKMNKGLFDKLNFSFDHYSRTTTKLHTETTQALFKDLLANGYVEKKETEQLYSPSQKQFLADRYVEGTCPACSYEKARGDECPKCGASFEATDLKNPRSKLEGAPLEKRLTTHWFLRYDLFKEKLKLWLSTKQWKPNVIKFVQNYVDDLKPRAITRDSNWGIPLPLPDTEGKVLYVWFDAPIGYISAAMEWAELKGEKEAWKNYWLDPKTKLVQFVGKDNIPFHAIFFPAMLMGQNQPYKLVDELPANEFYNLEGKQFSKSDGWTIDLEEFFNHFTSDQIRYAIASNAPESQDSEFTWEDFQRRCNTDLLGKYGNLANRLLTFVRKQCEEKTPKDFKFTPSDIEFLAKVKELAEKIKEAYAHFQLRKAAELIMELSSCGNAHFEKSAPWTLAKKPETLPEMRAHLFACLECVKVLALVAFPIIPEATETLWKMLGFSSSLGLENWQSVIETDLPQGRALPEPHILFKRAEDDVIKSFKDSLALMKKESL